MRVNTIAFCVLLTCTLGVAVGTHVDNVVAMLNGIATNVQGTVDTKSIASCGSETIFAQFEPALLALMNKIAGCNPRDISDITSKVTALINSIPDASKQCSSTNPESKKLSTGLGIEGLTPAQIQPMITSYVTHNVFSICGTFVKLNDKLKSGDFLNFGVGVGKIAVDIFKNSHKRVAKQIVTALMSAQTNFLEAQADNLLDILKGVVSGSKAAGTEVDSIVKCFDENLSGSIVTALGAVAKIVATCDFTKINDISALLNELASKFNPDHLSCLGENESLKTIVAGLGVTADTAAAIITNVATYAMTHIPEICMTAAQVSGDISSGNFNQFGVDVVAEWFKMTA